MYYFIAENPSAELVEISIEGVKKIIEINKKGALPETFEEYIVDHPISELNFKDAAGQDSINRFDKKKNKRRKGGRKKINKNKRVPQTKIKSNTKEKQKKDA